jgi:D-alanyl-D-alanine dipeptidase
VLRDRNHHKQWPVLIFLFCCCFVLSGRAQETSSFLPGPKPADIRADWKPWIGDYGSPKEPRVVLERDGDIFLFNQAREWRLKEVSPGSFAIPTSNEPNAPLVRFSRQPSGGLVLITGKMSLDRLDYGIDAKEVARIKPVRPIEDLRKEALAASPPGETGNFRKPELAELSPLDPSIHLDIRYATSNDFLGTPVYSQARAFLQRPAAESLLRIQKKLRPLGYGLLIHDAYRPWYVTKLFWEATPPEGKIFVADPAQGSRHNRGCAVDLTLYDLATGKPIEMPGTYDEMSPRSFPSYPGGTSLQRWHRDLLRRAMESEGFTVYESEWWHFDFKDWKEYPILNVPFEKLDSVGTTGFVH